jgi:hypothetical protein
MSRTSNKATSEKKSSGELRPCEVSVPARKAPRRSGRKPAALKTTAPRSRRKIAPGRGAERLRNSVNVILNDESDRIARALVDKTIAGNMSGARLLVELSGTKHPPAKPEEKAEEKDDGPSLSEILMSRGEWVKIEEFDRNPPLPGESLESYSNRNVYYLPPPKPDLPS